MAGELKKEEYRGFLKKREIRGYLMYHLIKILCPIKRIFTEVEENNESLLASYVPPKTHNNITTNTEFDHSMN